MLIICAQSGLTPTPQLRFFFQSCAFVLVEAKPTLCPVRWSLDLSQLTTSQNCIVLLFSNLLLTICRVLKNTKEHLLNLVPAIPTYLDLIESGPFVTGTIEG